MRPRSTNDRGRNPTMLRCLLLLLILALPACRRQAADQPPAPGPSAVQSGKPVTPEPSDLMTTNELAREGERLLPSLNTQQDVAHGTTWYQGAVPSEGNTAYLYCGKLGQGATVLRFVMRRTGDSWLDASGCSVEIDGRQAGSFVPNKVKLEKLPDGRVTETFDADFLQVAPIVLAMLDGNSATINLQGTNGTATIILGSDQIAEMRKVLAAYEYLNSGSAPPH